MIGDQPDMVTRLRSLIAPWYPKPAMAILSTPGGGDILSLPGLGAILSSNTGPPILFAALQAPSTSLAWLYGLLAFVKLQTRILTSTGGWLDLTAYDFFGSTFVRSPGQSDASFAAAIIAQIFLLRNTRQAITNVLTTLTGVAPVIFEPWRIPDSAALNSTLYYNIAGLRGSRTFPFNVFITAHTGGIATDAQIYAALESVRTAGITYWVQILNP